MTDRVTIKVGNIELIRYESKEICGNCVFYSIEGHPSVLNLTKMQQSELCAKYGDSELSESSCREIRDGKAIDYIWTTPLLAITHRMKA